MQGGINSMSGFSGPAKKTRQCIMNSLVILMEDKDFSKIATVDIISKSDVSKSTFYKYFFDKYNLVNQMLDDFMEQLKLIFKRAYESRSIKNFYYDFSQYLNHNYERIRCIFKTRDDNIDLKQKFQDLVRQEYLTLNCDREFDADYFALTFQWSLDYLIHQERFITMEDIKKIDEKINLSGLFVLNKKRNVFLEPAVC
jgi:AcrR family transcriptional regulator